MNISSIALAVSLTVVFTGDILLDRGVRQVVEHRGMDALFTPDVDSVLREADFVVGNLECPATEIRQPDFKQYVFRAEPEWLPLLHAHGFTHLNLANNHSIDQGRRGLISTRHHIIEAGMTPFGAGMDMEEACQPCIIPWQEVPERAVIIVPTLRLALENFAYLTDRPCVSQESEYSLLARISRLRTEYPAACIVVCPHWGGEHTLRPLPSQVALAHQIIDAGADLIVGHHTHTLQTIEEYRGRMIYYSVGNFIFDQHKPLNSRACMVRLTVTGDTFGVETIPIEIRNCRPHRLAEATTPRMIHNKTE